MASFQLAQPHSEREPTIVCKLFIGHYNNHSGAYIAGTQNYTGAYIIMASLQALVNNLLVY